MGNANVIEFKLILNLVETFHINREIVNDGTWGIEDYVSREKDALVRVLLDHQKRHVVVNVPWSKYALNAYVVIKFEDFPLSWPNIFNTYIFVFIQDLHFVRILGE